MSENHQIISRLPSNLYLQGSPVLIKEALLLRETTGNQLFARIALRNLFSDPVVSCTVCIHTFSADGTALETAEYSYSGLNVPDGECFGEETCVPLSNPAAVSFRVFVTYVKNSCGKVWTDTSDNWCSLTPQPPQEESIPVPDGSKEKSALPVPAAGDVSAASDERATAAHDDLHQIKSDALLENARQASDSTADEAAAHRPAESEDLSEQPAAPEAEAAPEETSPTQQLSVAPAAVPLAAEPETPPQTPPAEQKKRKRKSLPVIFALLILAIVLAVLIPNVIVPAVQRAQAYSAAEEMLHSGMHDEAHEAFTALGDYRNSRVMAMEARYQKANYLTIQEQFEEAISIWQELGSYSDSLARAEQAEFDWKDEDYQAALKLMEAGQFLEAANAFAALNDYRDSIPLVDECQALQLDADYRAADAAQVAGDYESAIRMFKALGSYADATERYQSANYEYGCLLLEQGKYEKAIVCFQNSNGHADAKEKITHANYLFGCALLDGGKFESAVAQFEKCSNYLDAPDKILKAKYGYVQAHMVRNNTTTQSYLKTLVAEKYPGAQNLYNELYAWKVEIIAYNNSPYSTVNQSTISKYGPMCIHFKVTGGEPGATINLVGNLTAPNGQNGNVYFNSCSDGDTLYATFEYYQPAYGATGTMSLRIYDENGKLMASGSVRVTN